MRRALVLSSVTVLAMLASGIAYADDPDTANPTEPVPIEVVTVNGSGCKPGTAHVTMSPDNTSFEVIYDDFTARAGGGASPIDFRKNCQLNVRIGAPVGYSYVIADVTYNGWAGLADGSAGLVRISYYIQGQSPTAASERRFAGPFEDDWQTVDSDVRLSTPCGEQRNLNINSELRVRAGGDRSVLSMMTMAGSSGQVGTSFRLDWRRC
jgi:hypothetical protein